MPIFAICTLYPTPRRVFAAPWRVTLLKKGMFRACWLRLRIAYTTAYDLGGRGACGLASWCDPGKRHDKARIGQTATDINSYRFVPPDELRRSKLLGLIIEQSVSD